MPDWLGQATVASNGTASVDMKHNISAVMWEVQQVSTSTGQISSACTSFIKKNGNLVAPSAALTPLDVGQGSTAAGLPYVYLTASDTLTMKVQGALAGDTLVVRAQYREFLLGDPEVEGR